MADLIPASSPALASSSSTSKAAALGPAHQHPQHHLRPVLRVGPPRPRVHGHQRVARVVAPGEQPLLLELRQALLDRGDLLVHLRLQRRVLGGHLRQPVEVLHVACSAANVSRRRDARECSADTSAARSASSQKPSAPISPSSAATRSPSPAGSKIVREQLHLLTDRSQALGRRLAGCGCGHAPTLSARGAVASADRPRAIAGSTSQVIASSTCQRGGLRT